MANTKQSKSNDSKGSENSGFKFCCGNSDAISQMMREFYGGENKNFDCEKMMQMMQEICCGSSVTPGQQKKNQTL